MKYLLFWVDVNSNLKWEVFHSRKEAENKITDIFSPNELIHFIEENKTHKLFEVVEIEPNFEFLAHQSIVTVEIKLK